MSRDYTDVERELVGLLNATLSEDGHLQAPTPEEWCQAARGMLGAVPELAPVLASMAMAIARTLEVADERDWHQRASEPADDDEPLIVFMFAADGETLTMLDVETEERRD